MDADTTIMSGLGAGTRPTGGTMLAAAWGLLRSNTTLMWLPVLSALATVVAVMLVVVPGALLLVPTSGDTTSGAAYVAMLLVSWLALFAATVVGVYFQVALLAAVFSYLDGRKVGVDEALGLANRRIGAILAWSALAATVGMLLRMLRERGVLGAIASIVAAIGWAVASFFVVPLIAAEGLSPTAALRRSTQLVRQTWGPSARATIRFGLVYLLALLPAFAVLALVILSAGRPSAVELALVVLAVVYLCVAGIVLSALGVVVRGVLYRYASGKPVPGVDPAALATALR